VIKVEYLKEFLLLQCKREKFEQRLKREFKSKLPISS